MPASNEKEVLERLLTEMDGSGAARRERRLRVENMVNRICVAIIVLATVSSGLVELVWHDLLPLIGAFAVGFSMAWDAARNAQSRNLEIVEKYLDRGRIERRLHSLTVPSEQ